MKPNSAPIYINKNSNRRPQVLKELPKAIEKRISTISSSKKIFNNSKIIHEDTLKKSGFQNILSYQQHNIQNNDEHQEKKKRKRNIIWYNPPHSINLKTNIDKVFFKLLHKHFPKTHKFYKIFNKNTVKLGYSNMRNMASIITTHNKIILKPNIQDYGCNCRKRNECPMQNKCLLLNIIYEAKVANKPT